MYLPGIDREQVTHQNLLRAMDALIQHKNALEAQLVGTLLPLFDDELEVVFYDLTTVGVAGEQRVADDRAIDVLADVCRPETAVHAAQKRTVAVERKAQTGIGMIAVTRAGFRGVGFRRAGHLIAGAISEGDDRYKLFERFKLRRAGGPFRRAIAQGAYWSMQARDKINEMT